MKDLFSRFAKRSLKTTGLVAALGFGTIVSSAALADPIALVLDRSEGVSVSAFSELLP